MKDHISKIIITPNGWPLEQFKDKPITNFFRRFLYGKYKVCEECWKRREKEIILNNNTNI